MSAVGVQPTTSTAWFSGPPQSHESPIAGGSAEGAADGTWYDRKQLDVAAMGTVTGIPAYTARIIANSDAATAEALDDALAVGSSAKEPLVRSASGASKSSWHASGVSYSTRLWYG